MRLDLGELKSFLLHATCLDKVQNKKVIQSRWLI